MSTRETGNYPSVFLMNADGSNQIDLTRKPDGLIGAWSSRAPAWSPNGEYIYFTGTRPDKPTEQIYLMRADGNDPPRRLTDTGVNAEATVRHVRPPVITTVTATPDVLWPPSNQMVRVSVSVGVSDDSDAAPACRIIDVNSDESFGGIGWRITGPLAVDLLAQRFGQGSGRIYTLTVACTNSSVLTSTAKVSVGVPHDQGK
jgi:WD40 repeat protein